jgi:hypothetical protein
MINLKMSMKNQFGVLVIACCALFVGCGLGGDSVIGSWENETGHIFTFREDGSMTWVYPSGAASDTFELQYRYDASAEPKILDLYGFEEGPLKGATLYGIVNFLDQEDEDVIRCNFNRGEDESVRPEEFVARRRTLYKRID